MAIEAIMFDLGRVLIDLDYSATIRALTARCRLTAEEFEKVVGDADLARRYETGEMTTRQFYEHLREVGTLDMPHSAFLEAWSSMLVPGRIVSEALLVSLKKQYPLVLLSNTNEAHIQHIAAHSNVLAYFDHKVLSFEVGAMKPDRRIYEFAIHISGKSANQLFFTDDRLENVQGARAAGIYAHQFRSEDGLIEALREVGVVVDVGLGVH